MLTCDLTHRVNGRQILKSVSFSLEAGSHLLILGDSGAGKTTLFSILAGIQKPASGHVSYDGQDIYALPQAQRDAFRGGHIGIIFQALHLIPVLTVKENLQLAGRFASGMADTRQMEHAIETLLRELGLGEKAHQRAENLSTGEQQRVAIARALVNRPRWIFADEPSSALDDKNTEATLLLLQAHAKKNGASLIIATHDQRVKEAFGQHTVIELKEGAKL